MTQKDHHYIQPEPSSNLHEVSSTQSTFTSPSDSVVSSPTFLSNPVPISVGHSLTSQSPTSSSLVPPFEQPVESQSIRQLSPPSSVLAPPSSSLVNPAIASVSILQSGSASTPGQSVALQSSNRSLVSRSLVPLPGRSGRSLAQTPGRSLNPHSVAPPDTHLLTPPLARSLAPHPSGQLPGRSQPGRSLPSSTNHRPQSSSGAQNFQEHRSIVLTEQDDSSISCPTQYSDLPSAEQYDTSGQPGVDSFPDEFDFNYWTDEDSDYLSQWHSSGAASCSGSETVLPHSETSLSRGTSGTLSPALQRGIPPPP